jgi:hypothetical protein
MLALLAFWGYVWIWILLLTHLTVDQTFWAAQKPGFGGPISYLSRRHCLALSVVVLATSRLWIPFTESLHNYRETAAMNTLLIILSVGLGHIVQAAPRPQQVGQEGVCGL